MPDKDDRVNPQVRYSSREEIATDEEHRPLISSGAESKPCNGVRGQGKLGDPTSEHDLDNDPDSAIPLLPLEAAEKAEVFPPTVIKIQGHVDGSGANGCRPKTSLVEPPCSALWPSDGSVVNGMGVQAVNQKLPGRHSNGTPVVYVTDRVATTYSAVPTVAVAPLYSQAPTCPVKGAHGSRMGVRLQGTHHVFTIVPVGSGELLAEQQQQQEGKAEAKAPLPQAVVSSSAPAPRHPAVVVSSSASFSAPTQRQALCTATAAPVRKISASSMRAVPTIPMSMVATLPTGLDPPLNNYRTVVAPPNMAVNYNPYHTITGMVPSTYPGREYGVGGGVSFLPQREYGVGSSPFYQRGEYGVGGGVPPSLGPVLAQRGPLGVPPSLAPVVAPRGPVTSSLHGAGAVSSPPKGMQRVATMPCSSRPMAYHMASRPLSPQGGWVGPVPLQPPTSEQLTVHSVNQMTVQSAGGLSIDVGSTDGRNVTVRGALTSPDQLPYLPAVFR
ncbi:hypothetical protein C7M84_017987 [Penaeus vannamei]|uniref:Uncharacterized protein n=1 Tax=Penaeus vannamei TaxID=6689 RepID=A0A3R7NQI5_PENVA|nr:hypothetical protein C7M84_017987 [Penaeus vannamei]